MNNFSSSSITKALADVSINLASGWFGILLISPGYLNISFGKYLELLTLNLPPAIMTLALGILLSEKSSKL